MNNAEAIEGTEQVLEDLGHVPTQYEDEIAWRMPTAEEATALLLTVGTSAGRSARPSLRGLSGMKLSPIILTGQRARLEPLTADHASDLTTAAADDSIWTYLDEPTPWTHETVSRFINEALEDQVQGIRVPYAIVDLATGRAVGSTSYLDIRPHDRSVEIGWTWLSPATWRTGINREAKYLLLAHAFESGAIRVALKTDARNERSRRAIEALGATYEGTWRNHRILSDGHRRDSAYFSVIDTDWPEVQQHLAARLDSSTRPA